MDTATGQSREATRQGNRKAGAHERQAKRRGKGACQPQPKRRGGREAGGRGVWCPKAHKDYKNRPHSTPSAAGKGKGRGMPGATTIQGGGAGKQGGEGR
jgi:hypothetical protein